MWAGKLSLKSVPQERETNMQQIKTEILFNLLMRQSEEKKGLFNER